VDHRRLSWRYAGRCKASPAGPIEKNRPYPKDHYEAARAFRAAGVRPGAWTDPRHAEVLEDMCDLFKVDPAELVKGATIVQEEYYDAIDRARGCG
jgi:hypothetical protein